MKRIWLLLCTVLLASTVCFPIVYLHYTNEKNAVDEDFFFGVSFGSDKPSEAKLLIDKVKGYTNLLVINNWDICTNKTILNEICEYAYDADLYFMVFFDWVSRVVYPWHQTWLDTAEERFGDKFLGVYLFDEPGGKQIDTGYWKTSNQTIDPRHWNGDHDIIDIFENVSDYSEAAELFVADISSMNSTKDLKRRNIPMFTSDYALYWFDYLAGYDAVFVELGWNHRTTKHIALGRGAANVQEKDWGAIIVWKSLDPEDENKGIYKTGPEMLQDMIVSYQAGAKYVIIFNFPHEKPYGILEKEHFNAMEAFWNMTRSPNKNSLEKVSGEVAFVLPKDYGWGMRWLSDKIWKPAWGPDNQSLPIWENMNKLIERCGLRLDIIYNDTRFDFMKKYSEVYYWNSVID
ncbi:MAG: hypothetical protein JSW14_01260 [Candidatus Bathyarchaeum sp.]|nr:MAG: hypothetical protein JSW14_01260 [Candidatus Bathyarchaeum sp.]